jgi:chromatin structure-remodeling complex subunit RSC3/30
MCYIGLPAAGILTSKLLAEHRPQITSPFREPLAANIRKLIIQKLGAYVSHLTFQVQPYQGNYQIVQQGATYIRWVLDRINAPKCPQPAPLTSDIDLPENWLDDCDSEGNPDFMAWFDNIQWAQDSLLNFT